MKQLTKQEIIELMVTAFHNSANRPGIMGVADHIEASLKALEKEGVLMMVEEAPPMPDYIEDTIFRLSDYKCKCETSIEDHEGSSIRLNNYKQELATVKEEIDAIKIVRDKGYYDEWVKAQRANTPVYLCSKD